MYVCIYIYTQITLNPSLLFPISSLKSISSIIKKKIMKTDTFDF